MGVEDSPLRDTMVFLVGARRSGTNWLQRVLASHPEVYAIPSETYVFSEGLQPLSERVHHGAVEVRRTGAVFMDRADFVDASRDFCDRLFGGLRERSDPAARRIVERTPWHAHSVDLIADVYPDAWVLHIIRDGRDVSRSLLSQPWGPDTMGEAAAEWRETVELAQAARKPASYREVRYEELLADPARTVPARVEWLGLNADPETVERMLTEAGIKYNVDPSAPKTKAGKWSELPADQLAEFARVAGALNAELGYDQDPGPGGDASAAEASPLPEREQESIAVRARRQLAEARARVSGKPPPGFDREILNRLEYAEYVFERLLDAMHSDPRRIADILTEEVDIRVVGSEDEWEGRGSEQAGRLIDVLRADPALRDASSAATSTADSRTSPQCSLRAPRRRPRRAHRRRPHPRRPRQRPVVLRADLISSTSIAVCALTVRSGMTKARPASPIAARSARSIASSSCDGGGEGGRVAGGTRRPHSVADDLRQTDLVGGDDRDAHRERLLDDDRHRVAVAVGGDDARASRAVRRPRAARGPRRALGARELTSPRAELAPALSSSSAAARRPRRSRRGRATWSPAARAAASIRSAKPFFSTRRPIARTVPLPS